MKLENQGSFKNDKESFTTLSGGFGISMRRFFMLVIGYRQGFKKLKNNIGNDFSRKLMQESIILNSVFNINSKSLPYKLYLTYSMDINISELYPVSSGTTHEVSLNIYFGNVKCKTKKRRKRSHWWSSGLMNQQRFYNREICDPFPKISDWDGY